MFCIKKTGTHGTVSATMSSRRSSRRNEDKHQISLVANIPAIEEEIDVVQLVNLPELRMGG